MKMKRKALALLLALMMALSCMQVPAMAVSEAPADNEPIESVFTDAVFLQAVRELVGKTNGEHIYQSDVEDITELDVSDLYIADLNGIEYFCALRELYCYGNDLLTLNLSHNSNLEVLDCSYNDLLETLDVSGCPELTSLDCNYTSLQKLDVRNNAKLTRLVCFSTFLRTLNISNNPLLEELDTYDTRLANLDVSNNPNLGYLDCSENYMSSIDCVSGRDYTLLQDTTFTFEPQKTDPVTDSFTDEKFLDAVRDTIEKPDGDIYLTDLVEVTNLTVNNSGLTSLDGIEYMTALE